MLSAQTQGYLELSWEAGVLATRFERLASGEQDEDDPSEIKKAAEAFERLLKDVKTPGIERATRSYPLFSRTTGLNVTLSAFKPSQLREIAVGLREVSQALDENAAGTESVKQKSRVLQNRFIELERQAKVRAAVSKGRPSVFSWASKSARA